MSIRIKQERCIGCGQCRKVCAHDAPSIVDRKASIDQNKCVGCGHCADICPRGIINLMDLVKQ